MPGIRQLTTTTKFNAPPIPAVYVDRPHLRAMLDRSTDVPLTTVVGSPGSGKSVTLVAWLASRTAGHHVWMSCDERDASTAQFWRSLTAALRRDDPDRWMEVADLVDEPDPDPSDVAVAIVNELDALGEPISIVIDDFHLASAAAPSLAQVVESLPPHAHIVVASRTEPLLPLHRMRVRHQLLELREGDLRFSLEETKALFAAMGWSFDAESMAAVQERTEGWVAALHLLALTLSGHADAEALVRTASSQNRFIAEFLVGEVLAGLPEEIHRFLLESSILDEMNGSICEAVTGIVDSGRMLRDLAAQNMLVIRLAEEGTFRYHHLFRDLLRLELHATDPKREAVLHKVGAQWFEQHGDLDRAAGHLVRAGDASAAFGLLREHMVGVFLTGGAPALQRFVEQLDLRTESLTPGQVVDVAVALAIGGAVDEAERWIDRAARGPAQPDGRDAARLTTVQALVAMLRGEPEACEAALAEMPPLEGIHDEWVDGLPSITIRSRLYLDDTAGARARFHEARERRHTQPYFDDVLMPAALAWVACVEGHLDEADEIAERAVAVAAGADLTDHPGLADALRAQGRVLYERGRFDEAEALLERSIILSEPTRPPFALLGHLTLARLWVADGRVANATDAIEHARGCLPVGSRSPLLALIDACDARVALAQGDIVRAQKLAASMLPSQRKSALEALVHLADDRPEVVLEITDHLLLHTPRQRLDAAVLRCRALHELRHENADAAVDAAISAARAHGFTMVIAAELPGLGPRISRRLRSAPLGPFERSVLDLLDRPIGLHAPQDGLADLREQLSGRELTVLRYLESRLTVTEIASELYISVNTIKTHLKAVYRKLGVSSRRAALEEGRRLRLL